MSQEIPERTSEAAPSIIDHASVFANNVSGYEEIEQMLFDQITSNREQFPDYNSERLNDLESGLRQLRIDIGLGALTDFASQLNGIRDALFQFPANFERPHIQITTIDGRTTLRRF